MNLLRRLRGPSGGGVESAVQIPYRAHVGPNVVRTEAGHYVMAWRLLGEGFECADARALNTAHQRLNAWLRSLSAPEIAFWSHIVRRRDQAHLHGEAPAAFANRMINRYRERIDAQSLWANDLYLSMVYRPIGSRATTRALSALDAAPAGALEVAESVDAMSKLGRQLEASLADLRPAALGTYEFNGALHSRLMEYLALLVNADAQRMPLGPTTIDRTLGTARLLMGWETMEYRGPTSSRFGAFLGIKEYPAQTRPGLLDGLLTVPFSFVLTQSFTCLSKSVALALLSRQSHRLRNSGDAAVSQAAALTNALDKLAGSEFSMGDHHLSLQILTEPADASAIVPRQELACLERSIATARSIMSDAGLLMAREDIALEPSYWAQLPGAFPPRPRIAPISSRNFAAFSSFHNYPGGRPNGNHWGESLAPLKTTGGSPYYFSLHATDLRDPTGGSRRDTGHTFVCGPTGSGKTVFLAFCVCLLSRQAVTQIVFDKDRGLELLIRALGGTYLSMPRGRPTGCNPLQLPDSPGNRSFLRRWLGDLVTRPGRPLSVKEDHELDQALEGTLTLERESRRLSRLLEFLDPTVPDGPHARLSTWCAQADGSLSWTFDCPTDLILDQLHAQATVGFDMTEVIDDPVIRGPLTRYLFHLVESLLDGRRVVAWLDEFSKLVTDDGFAELAGDGTKTWRKRNGVVAFVTQSPSDVLNSPIARTLIEQTPTKVIFPNADARREDYVDALGLNEREYALVKSEIPPGSKRFLVKQGGDAVVVELDLEGFDSELAILSGRTETLKHVRVLVDRYGSEPAAWLPALLGECEVKE